MQNCNKELNCDMEWGEIENLLNQIKIPKALLGLQNSNADKVVLFGVGMHGQIALQYFKKNKINVVCYCDNDKDKQGKIIDNIPVISIQELVLMEDIIIVISSKHHVIEISTQLSKMNLECISFDAYIVKLMKDEYKRIYFDIIDEPWSKKVYAAVLKSMITGSKRFCSSVMEGNVYWAIPEFVNTGNEVFIDAGAYVGDTIEQFIWNNMGTFKKIYAFEPGEKQYNAMLIRINRLVEEWAIDREKIICIKAGLGEKNNTLFYSYNESSPPNSNFVVCNSKRNIEVKIYSLDDYLGQENITMIKADIEGFEIEMLKGAELLIRRNRPKLAISLYHKPQDLFEIINYIKTLVPEYKLAIRHHANNLLDTVLYCWIE